MKRVAALSLLRLHPDQRSFDGSARWSSGRPLAGSEPPLGGQSALVFRSNQMIHSLRVRPRQAAAPRGWAVNHVFDPEH